MNVVKLFDHYSILNLDYKGMLVRELSETFSRSDRRSEDLDFLMSFHNIPQLCSELST